MKKISILALMLLIACTSKTMYEKFDETLDYVVVVADKALEMDVEGIEAYLLEENIEMFSSIKFDILDLGGEIMLMSDDEEITKTTAAKMVIAIEKVDKCLKKFEKEQIRRRIKYKVA
jgi:hypothetical protein